MYCSLFSQMDAQTQQALIPAVGVLVVTIALMVFINQVAAWLIFHEMPGFFRMGFALLVELVIAVVAGVLCFVLGMIALGAMSQGGEPSLGMIGLPFTAVFIVVALTLTVHLRAYVLRNIADLGDVGFFGALGHLLMAYVLNLGLGFVVSHIPVMGSVLGS